MFALCLFAHRVCSSYFGKINIFRVFKCLYFKFTTFCIKQFRKWSKCVIFPSGRPSSLVKEAKEMKGQIEEYLQNYQPLKSLPNVVDSLLNDYVDKTKGISEEERDELTSYLSLKYKDIFNLSVSSDIPSMMHNTISFIIRHSGHKGTTILKENKSYLKFLSPLNI